LTPLLLDTSVWVEHLRRDALTPMFPRLRTRYLLHLDAVVAAELAAGCRSKRERRVVGRLGAPFERAGRLLVPERADFARAAAALSTLRERGTALANPGAALLDALIAAVARRCGALLVTRNERDFGKLAGVLALRWRTFDDFCAELTADES
jgi:predicted nucleic acid-binding protein